MAYRGLTGVLSTVQNDLGLEVVWSIKDFLSLSVQDGSWYNSPTINFNNSKWWVRIIPNGWSGSSSYGYVDLRLRAQDEATFPISLSISVSFRTASGLKSCERHDIKVFTDQAYNHAFFRLISREELRKNKFNILPSGILTVACILKVEIPPGTENLSDIKMKYEETSSQTEEEENLESVCQDYKKILLDGSNHDLILKVGDVEFRAHRDILKARSKVFYSMLSHDMLEKNSDAIKIPDCDPEAMKLFLLYVYCGRVEGLDQSNMLGLYYIADKYEMISLKEECHNFIKMSLNSTNFCSIIQLALDHCDSSLLERATEFFLYNVVDILRTVEWQSFMKTNSTIANELFIKSHEKKK